MQETEKLIVFAHLAAQGYPQDFCEGFVTALVIDTAACEPKAMALLEQTLDHAKAAQYQGLVGEVIRAAFQIRELSIAQASLAKKAEAAKRLAHMLDLKEEGSFGSRIAYRKITDAISKIKA